MNILKELYFFGETLRPDRVGDTLWILLMVSGYYFLYQGKNELIKKTVIYPSLIYTVLVLNPLSSYILSEKLGFSARMYRFMWMFPVVLILGYAGICLIEKLDSWKRRGFLICFMVMITFFTQNNNPIDYQTENVYKVQDELLSVIQILHEQVMVNETATVFFEEENLLLTVRQYDPTIKLPGNYYVVSEALKAIKQSEGEESMDYFLELSKIYNVEYVVVSSDTHIFDGQSSVCFKAGTTQNNIYEIIAE